MVHEMIGRCPICDGKLQIGRLICSGCDTSIDGRFEPCKFCRLTKDQRQFAEVFIMCRGNIKEVEKELGISYPTVRGRLEQLIGALGGSQSADVYPNPPVPVNNQPYGAKPRVTGGKDILESLDRGDISVEEALKRLRGRREL
jgi:hypothetical protein